MKMNCRKELCKKTLEKENKIEKLSSAEKVYRLYINNFLGNKE